MGVVSAAEIGADPTLPPRADVGTTSVTVKGKRGKRDDEPEPTPEPEARADRDDREQRLIAAGFVKAHGAWRRGSADWV